MVISLAGTSLDARIPLSPESEKSIIITSLKSGLVAMAGVGAFFALPALLKRKSLEGEEIAVALIFSALAGGAGSAIGSLWKARNVPEAQFTYAETELSSISQDNVLVLLFSADSQQWIPTLKTQFCRSQFPLLAAFNYLNAIYTRIINSQKSLDMVAHSHRVDLHMQVKELQLFAEVIARFLPDVLSAITNEPNFTLECSAKAQQDAAFAQMMQVAYPHYSSVYIHTY